MYKTNFKNIFILISVIIFKPTKKKPFYIVHLIINIKLGMFLIDKQI